MTESQRATLLRVFVARAATVMHAAPSSLADPRSIAERVVAEFAGIISLGRCERELIEALTQRLRQPAIA